MGNKSAKTQKGPKEPKSTSQTAVVAQKDEKPKPKVDVPAHVDVDWKENTTKQSNLTNALEIFSIKLLRYLYEETKGNAQNDSSLFSPFSLAGSYLFQIISGVSDIAQLRAPTRKDSFR